MKEKLDCNVMVGVSTEQNSTNLVPFIQFDGAHLILAETDEAKSAGWTNGPYRVVKEFRKKECTRISIGIGDDLANTIKILNNELNTTHSICWNFGGGQKIQQLALFELFTKRVREGKKDWACYSEPKNRLTYIIKSDKSGNFTSRKIQTDAFMTLEEILATFGNRMRKEVGECLWSRYSPSRSGSTSGQVLTNESSSWLYDYHKRQKMFRYFDLDTAPPPPGEKVFPGKFAKFGEYFEKVVQKQILEIISGSAMSHTINEVWANVHIFPQDTSGQVAEYDVLLVTNFGTVIPLDAKSYKFDKKDEHARLHNLTKVSGRYTTIWSVFPYFKEDLKPESYLFENRDWRQLVLRPFEMAQRNSQMLVVTEKGSPSFILAKGRKNKVKVAGESVKNSVTVHPIESLVDILNLRRKPLV